MLARRSGQVWHSETNGIPADYLCDDNLALVGKECCSRLVGKDEREQVAHAQVTLISHAVYRQILVKSRRGSPES